MLILLYSDTNYNLDGFRATFSVTNCLNNCSSNGLCVNHSCLCTNQWSGVDCSIQLCNCGDDENRGFCDKNKCKCFDGFSGQSCSLHKHNFKSSQWHWITNGSQSFTPRAAHNAIYSEETDEMYIFGGYDLNNVIWKMEIYNFKKNQWFDEKGQLLKVDVSVNKCKYYLVKKIFMFKF